MNERTTTSLVFVIVGTSLIVSVVGVIVLTAMRLTVPDILVVIISTAIGGLLGAVRPGADGARQMISEIVPAAAGAASGAATEAAADAMNRARQQVPMAAPSPAPRNFSQPAPVPSAAPPRVETWRPPTREEYIRQLQAAEEKGRNAALQVEE